MSTPSNIDDYFVGINATIYINGMLVGYIRQIFFTFTQETKRYNPLGKVVPIFLESMRYARIRVEGAYWDNRLLALAMGVSDINKNNSANWRTEVKNNSLTANSDEGNVFYRYKDAKIQVSINSGGSVIDSDNVKRTIIFSDIVPTEYQFRASADDIITESFSGYALSWNFINDGV